MERYIIPAVIGEKFSDIEAKVALVSTHVSWIQIDLVDGIFSPQKTWPFGPGGAIESSWGNTLASLVAKYPNLKIELHLMVSKPEQYLSEIVASKVARVLFHVEATENLASCLLGLVGSGIEAGVTLLLDTPLATVSSYYEKISSVQLMSIAKIGAYGEPFQERVIPKLEELRASYHGTITLDGGISTAVASSLFQAGANGLVAGSAIFKAPDIPTAVASFFA